MELPRNSGRQGLLAEVWHVQDVSADESGSDSRLSEQQLSQSLDNLTQAIMILAEIIASQNQHGDEEESGLNEPRPL